MALFFEKVWETSYLIFLIYSQSINKINNKYYKFYDPKQKSKLFIYLDVNNLCGYTMWNVFLIVEFKLVDPEEFSSNIYRSNCLKDLSLDVHLKSPDDLLGLHTNYLLALDKIETKKKK